ncbi:hypothetical protein BXY70_2435 [Roseovarius halotolerans]|uniref:DUF4177 domain-containing protein n=1 Tax=Roseovarius halotolerans TaxID=505353 RepID=A0A1X6Z9H7_9RHOB|nr:DUF4177 domain-containing protein [Roseovarius halotolerans]RKT30446.1 hypothetical protein BXY70_2435 [Roseovarius halotolerans]SLN44484.1 hypothetical protein ROH8110_02332 [Roseovarius halotolerans]
MYEYKVLPAPTKGKKAAGLKGPAQRFAHALEATMNEVAADGWEYHRSDILPSEERQGLTSSQTVYRSVLVFRRPLHAPLADLPPVAAPAEDSAGDNPDIVANEDTAAGADPIDETETETEPDQSKEPPRG